MNRHPLDLFSLVAGVLAVGTAVVLLLPGLGPATLSQLFPVAVIALGVALLASARSRTDVGRDDTHARGPEGTADPAARGGDTDHLDAFEDDRLEEDGGVPTRRL